MPWKSNTLGYALTFERAAMTPSAFATILVPALLGFYLMAVLVQLPRTTLFRLALLPVVLWCTFRASISLDFSWNHPDYTYLNQSFVVAMFTFAMRSTTWVLAKQPYSKLPMSNKDAARDSDSNRTSASECHISIPVVMWNACDLVVNPRGIGWDGPEKMPLPTPYLRVESRTWFTLISLGQFIFLMLLFDVLRTSLRLLGPDTFGTPQGGTIFDPMLSPSRRYLKSSLVTLITWICLYVFFSASNQLWAIILFAKHPSKCPPLFDSPWKSTSLSSFWGRRWHQLFREFFVAVGGKPLERYFGNEGKVMGAFAMSAVLHDIGVWGMGRGAHRLQVMGFFFIQGVGIVVERRWKRATGRPVGGLLGWLWTMIWVLSWGNALVDAWGKSGLLGSKLGLFFPSYHVAPVPEPQKILSS